MSEPVIPKRGIFFPERVELLDNIQELSQELKWEEDPVERQSIRGAMNICRVMINIIDDRTWWPRRLDL